MVRIFLRGAIKFVLINDISHCHGLKRVASYKYRNYIQYNPIFGYACSVPHVFHIVCALRTFLLLIVDVRQNDS